MVKKKAVVYGRVSTNKKEQEQSLDIQTISLTELCTTKGYKLEKVYAEKRTATSVRHRKEFLKMMYDCGLDFKKIDNGTDHFTISKDRKPMYDVIFVKEASRISRHSQQGLDIVARLNEQNVDIYFANTGKFVSEMDNFTLTILFSSAQNESQSTSDRIKFSKRKLAEHNVYRPSKIPYGYMKQYHDETKKTYDVVINNDEADVVTEIFEMYIQKKFGTIMIANNLNNREIKARGTKKGWSYDKVGRIISNPIYYGSPIEHRYSKKSVIDDTFKIIEGNEIQLFDVVEPIISKELFEQAQEIKKSRKDEYGNRGIHKSKDNTYKRKIKCLQCGAYYVRHDNKKGVTMYACSTKNKYGSSYCNSGAITTTQLNKYLNASEIIINVLTLEGTYKILKEAINNAYTMQEELIKTKRNRIEEFNGELKITLNALKRESDEFILESYREEIKDTRNKISEIELELNELNAELIEKLNEKVEQKYSILHDIKNRKTELFTFEERIELLKEIRVGKEFLEVEYSIPSFNDEIMKFNKVFGENLGLDGHNLESFSNISYYVRSKGKTAITMQEYYSKHYAEDEIENEEIIYQELKERELKREKKDKRN